MVPPSQLKKIMDTALRLHPPDLLSPDQALLLIAALAILVTSMGVFWFPKSSPLTWARSALGQVSGGKGAAMAIGAGA
jgi:hypothetical protein